MLHEGQVVAQHVRCYQRGQLIVLPDHRLAAVRIVKRSRGAADIENEFDASGPKARQFHLHLKSQPVKTGVHLRRLLGLARTLRGGGAACRSRSGLGAGDLRRRVHREPLIGGTPGGDFPRPRCPLPGGEKTDRRDRIGTHRPGDLRPFLQRHQGGLR